MNTFFLDDLIFQHADSAQSGRDAVRWRAGSCTYAELASQVDGFASHLQRLGLNRFERVAIYLPKQIETVVSVFATSRAGGVFVPVNPILKPRQVGHILADSEAAVLITSGERLEQLAAEVDLEALPLRHTILVTPTSARTGNTSMWQEGATDASPLGHSRVDNDLAALFYTSGSTGAPKGVAITHRNLVVGGKSVASYLGNNGTDRILSVLPLSFDAGFSQLTTGFESGASVFLLDYLLASDVVSVVAREGITGITGVPPLWMQLVQQRWPDEARSSIRYFANTGGKMPLDTLTRLRALFHQAQPFLMYGLTEAFRSTYLPPAEIDRRPDSIGKAIPNAEVLVVREDGSECEPDEVGELVHRGPLVSLGYWRDAERTRARFRPAPNTPDGLVNPEIAVWSGDWVKRDGDGFLYFVGRKDDMIKTSGYRVSPTEVEESAFASGLVTEVAAIGVAHRQLGQAIVLVATAVGEPDPAALLAALRRDLPAYMVPLHIDWRDSLPRGANGKIDRRDLSESLKNLFVESEECP